jgi:hypothetical protein
MIHIITLLFSRNVLLLILFIVTSYILMIHLAKKFTKQKGKYESLRMEAIDHLYSSWVKAKSSNTKDIISEEMKEKYDINLTYKS